MKSPLRILLLEDDAHDAELVQELLEGEGVVCEISRVETQETFVARIERGGLDLILADYTLPSFDGLSALRLAKQDSPELPFIFVSGTLGEEVAIEALKVGATDYVLKTRLSRLVPSVDRALREAEERAERKRAQDALQRSERYLAEAQKLTRSGSWAFDVGAGRFVHWSSEHYRIFGFDPGQGIPSKEAFFGRIDAEDQRAVSSTLNGAASKKHADSDLEYRIVLPGGARKHIRSISHPVLDESGAVREYVGTVMDITEQHQAQAALETALKEIKGLRDQLYNENVVLREEIVQVSMFEEIVGILRSASAGPGATE